MRPSSSSHSHQYISKIFTAGFTLMLTVFSPSSTRGSLTESVPGRTPSIVTTSPGVPQPSQGQASTWPDTGATVAPSVRWRRDQDRLRGPRSPRCGVPGQSSLPAAVTVVAVRLSASESVAWLTSASVLTSTRLRSGPAISTPAPNPARQLKCTVLTNIYFLKVQLNQIKTFLGHQRRSHSSRITRQ